MEYNDQLILGYIDQWLQTDDPVLCALKDQHKHKAHKDVRPNIGLQIGTFLAWFITLTRAKRVIEFGTCLGYSTIFLGQALRKTGGQLISIEHNPTLFEMAQEHIQQAGLSACVQLMLGDAEQLFQDIEGPFDVILQDADKALYPRMLEACIEKLKPGGILAADNALFPAMPYPEKLSNPIQSYNEKIFSDPRLSSTILPIGSGLAISYLKE